MKKIFFEAVPFDKGEVTLALESGVDAVIAEAEHLEAVRALSKIPVLDAGELEFVALKDKSDEEETVRLLAQGRTVILREGWEIIPVENILAQSGGLAVEAAGLDRARLAAGILERGVATVVVTPQGAGDLKSIVRELKLSQGVLPLETATITAITPAGLGHRVCVDTMTLMRSGQGMLVGNSSAFTFLVNAETESNPYVAPRPFRINAGAVHAYAVMPGDRTSYLEELRAGTEVLLAAADGSTTLATVGRCKTEVRPMLLIEARCGDRTGAVFLQNAETIRLVRADGAPVSVVDLATGDTVLCRTDQAGRHFGMRIDEDIRE
ncbi:3-dehydroquinate synthase II family protein [Desulfomicrobium orale]|uniref:3-dehydroquinate synthase n=1 Tax=Desulfomicrobium orale DSM 12838 TaxID=888061 RepID=A0A0X8JPS2_9BACT|nr:3-dehydroquinate synthase II family protein [Desulfomicrobium orale]AMD92679.1 3-dehydroquinate synthase [Desulfomicrobium orale DSM 12838]